VNLGAHVPGDEWVTGTGGEDPPDGPDECVPACPPEVSSPTTAIAAIALASSGAQIRGRSRREVLIVRVTSSISKRVET
jgi:hypothetical protein